MPIHDLSPWERPSRGHVLVPERRRLFPFMTVLENLEVGAYAPAARASLPQSLTEVFALLPTIGPYLLPNVAAKLRKQLPRLELMLYEYQTDPMLEKLHLGEIDVGILALPVPMDGLDSHVLYKEPFTVAMLGAAVLQVIVRNPAKAFSGTSGRSATAPRSCSKSAHIRSMLLASKRSVLYSMNPPRSPARSDSSRPRSTLIKP